MVPAAVIGGHGHVTSRPDGAKARCGGPALCPACALEEAQLKRRTSGAASVALDFTTTWCDRHLRPYKREWPRGAALAMAKLFDVAVRMQPVIDAAHGDAYQLQAALERFSPLCCFIPRHELDAIYQQTLYADDETKGDTADDT